MKSSTWTLLAALAASPLSAQVPAITEAGDPTVEDAEIYALSVDPADYSDQSVVVLFDDGVLRIDETGLHTRTFRTVSQVLKRQSVAETAEQVFGFDASRDSFRINWARVIGPDGEVISDTPLFQEESDVPTYGSEPVYTDVKQLRLSLSGVEVGSIVDISYSYETTSVTRSGDFLQAWLISGVAPVRRSRLRVEAPAGYQPRISVSPAAPEAEVVESELATTWEWTAEDLDPIRRELFMPQENALVHWVQISADDDWESIGRWYGETYPMSYDVTDVVAEASAAVVGDANGVDALESLYTWISRDLRYVSVTLGEGGYQARSPEEVVASQAGDCKDKAGLFIALARQLGFEAYPTILRNGSLDERAPSLGQLDHLIAAVRLDGEWVYVDLTNGWVPLGEVPFQYQGELGIIVKDDGSAEVIAFPEQNASELQSLTRFRGSVATDGTMSGQFETFFGGAAAQAIRPMMAFEMTDDLREEFARGFAAALSPRATGSLVSFFDAEDFEEEARIVVDVELDLRQIPGPSFLLELPFPPMMDRTLVRELTREPRQTAIVTEDLFGLVSTVTDFEIELPEGWVADLPESAEIDGPFGRYSARYEQEGRTLRLVREHLGARGEIPASEISVLIDVIETLADDDASLITLVGPGAG